MKYVYKIGAAVLAVAVILVMFFAPIITFYAQSTALMLVGYLDQMDGNGIANEKGVLPEYIGEELSISDVFFSDEASLVTSLMETVKNYGDGSSADLSSLELLIGPGIAFLLSLGITALIALAIVIVAFVVKDNRKVIYLSVAGMGSAYMIDRCFGAIAQPIIDQRISLNSLTDSWWAVFIGEVERLELTNYVWLVMAVFAVIIIWTVIYNYTLPEKEKKARLLMLGEAEEASNTEVAQ